MVVYRPYKLVFNNEVVGFRFMDDENNKFDVTTDVAKTSSLNLKEVTQKIELIEHGDVLVSNGELKSNNFAVDISDNSSLIEDIIKNLESEENTGVLQRRPKPKSFEKKEVKGYDSLQYKNGIAVTLNWISCKIDDTDVINLRYCIDVVFSDKEATTVFCDVWGYGGDKKLLSMDFDKGKKSLKLILDDEDFQSLRDAFDCPIGVYGDGFTLDCKNVNSRGTFQINLKPPHFEFDKDLFQEQIRLSTLNVYVEKIKQNVESGDYIFYPNIESRNLSLIK